MVISLSVPVAWRKIIVIDVSSSSAFSSVHFLSNVTIACGRSSNSSPTKHIVVLFQRRVAENFVGSIQGLKLLRGVFVWIEICAISKKQDIQNEDQYINIKVAQVRSLSSFLLRTRMIHLCQSPVSGFDFVNLGSPRNTQHLVKVELWWTLCRHVQR